MGGWVAAKAVPAQPSNGPGKLLRGSAVWTQGDKGRGSAEGLGQGEPSVNRVYCGVGTQGPRCGPTLLLVLAQARGTTAEGRAPWASGRLPAGPIWGLPRAGRSAPAAGSASPEDCAAALMCYDGKEVQINIINLAEWSL